MKQSIFLIILLTASLCGRSQSAGNDLFSVVEYMPAPGQFINVGIVGTPDAAGALNENQESLVSLGNFGGYIVLKFREDCLNHPDNPYGIDFTVFGNAFAGSSEPGVIWVMKDDNGNGLPDDVWYEIAGSNYYHSGTVRDYKVTYVKTGSRDVLWYDNKGRSGTIKANDFNLQEYYPSPEYFPDYPRDSVTFSGTLLSITVDSSNPAEIKITPPAFGYADCRPPKDNINLNLPDNPYTASVEGSGGDPVDISWAVDSDGNYVELDYINFVKIVSGSMTSAGWLGEISSEVSWIAAVDPVTGISGKQNLLVVYPHPDKLIAGSQMKLESCWFESGRKKVREINYSSDNESVLTVNDEGLVSAWSTGSAQISLSAGDTTYTAVIDVVEPASIEIKTDLSALFPGDTVLLSAAVYDNLGASLDIPVRFESSDTLVGKVVTSGNSCFFIAIDPGETTVKCFIDNFSVEGSVQVRVNHPDGKMKIYMSVKTEDENLLPFQWVEAGYADLNRLVKERNNDYSVIDRLTLFHALAAGLQKAGVNFTFLDDENAGGNLYLYSVEDEGLFIYGWGGRTDPEIFARAWIARLNGRHYVNSFDDIPIADGDTVDLYNVYDITNPWLYRRLLADKDTASENEEIELLLEEAECKYEDGVVTESEFLPVVNGEISDGSSVYYTGENGIAVFLAGNSLPLVISSGNSAVLLLKSVTTGMADIYQKTGSFSVYPNPFNDLLTVKGDGAELFSVTLTDQSGRILINESSQASVYEMRTGHFVTGSYILVITSESKRETYKLIKK
jgi:hypothetical protein